MIKLRVVIEKLNKKFKDHQVLKDVSLEVNDHEVVVVMGESGCGKTTLLRCLCDLEQPDAGKISLDDWVVYGGQSKLSRQERQRYHRQAEACSRQDEFLRQLRLEVL